MGQSVQNGKGSQQYPYFQSAGGGLTPYQQDLSTWLTGSDIVDQTSNFANSGTGMSTMATQAGGVGPAFVGAESLTQSSDANQNAQFGAYQNAEKINNQNIAQGQSAANQSFTDLLSLAKQANVGGGSSGG